MIVIDLHLHTTASDGSSTPERLVEEAHSRGIRVFSVTDHDTMAGHMAAAAAAAHHGLTFVPGIEITSVHEGRDVHVLAYGLAPDTASVTSLLEHNRSSRLARAREIAARLRLAGAPIGEERLVAMAAGMSGKAIARPQIAMMLCDAGHVSSVAEAFDRYLSEGRPAYVPHTGTSPVDVIRLVRESGGVASLAHPGVLDRDDLLPIMAEAGLQCLEAHHSAHDAEVTAHYRALAERFSLVCTGGSDYHGAGTRRSEFFGKVTLPRKDFDRFALLLPARPTHSASFG